ncbi:MAG: AbrB/MazE/SpoVT family DNA-binding domain-containing protein [Psychrosphaera sp.]|nr:AbrB/MazE/SpoVT family DNA-binding domain-containing protein [Psychrosphaera sp.]
MSIVTSKGQATIPKHIRQLLNIKPGETTVDFVVVDDRVELINTQTLNPFAKVRGITKGKLSTDQIMGMTRG